jgi:hypothetical protein
MSMPVSDQRRMVGRCGVQIPPGELSAFLGSWCQSFKRSNSAYYVRQRHLLKVIAPARSSFIRAK